MKSPDNAVLPLSPMAGIHDVYCMAKPIHSIDSKYPNCDWILENLYTEILHLACSILLH